MKFISISTIKIAGLILMTLVSTIAVAHPGHGGLNELSHSLEHLLWLSAGVSLVIYSVYHIIKKKLKS
jgi:hypothetical protein